MPQLVFPSSPAAIGVEVSLLGALFGLSWDKALTMGILYYGYNTFVQSESFVPLTKPAAKKTDSQPSLGHSPSKFLF